MPRPQEPQPCTSEVKNGVEIFPVVSPKPQLADVCRSVANSFSRATRTMTLVQGEKVNALIPSQFPSPHSLPILPSTPRRDACRCHTHNLAKSAPDVMKGHRCVIRRPAFAPASRAPSTSAKILARSLAAPEENGYARDDARRGFVRRYFFKPFEISLAAFAPEPPVTPVPGCVPLPHT